MNKKALTEADTRLLQRPGKEKFPYRLPFLPDLPTKRG
jgi:hypothetical protein